MQPPLVWNSTLPWPLKSWGNRYAPLCVASGRGAKGGWDKISFCNIRFGAGNRFVSQTGFKLLAILPQPPEILQIRVITAPCIYTLYLSPDRISCCPGWPQTPCAAEDPLASTTSVLGSEACITISRLCSAGGMEPRASLWASTQPTELHPQPSFILSCGMEYCAN